MFALHRLAHANARLACSNSPGVLSLARPVSQARLGEHDKAARITTCGQFIAHCGPAGDIMRQFVCRCTLPGPGEGRVADGSLSLLDCLPNDSGRLQ